MKYIGFVGMVALSLATSLIASSSPSQPTASPSPSQSQSFVNGELVYAKDAQGNWKPAQIRGRGGGQYGVVWKGSNTSERIKQTDNRIISLKEAAEQKYWKLPEVNLTVGAPSRQDKVMGVACGSFSETVPYDDGSKEEEYIFECVTTYAPEFTTDANASTTDKGTSIQWKDTDPLVKATIEETNRVRQNPVAYASELESKIFDYAKPKGNGGVLPSPDWEVLDDVVEAIAYLKKAKPGQVLQYSQGMSLANRDLIAFHQSEKKNTTHDGPNGNKPWDRVKPYGKLTGAIAENLGYAQLGDNTKPPTIPTDDNQSKVWAKEIIMGLIVDTGQKPQRGHRVAIFDSQSNALK
jgi:uncharacterized protein YkwD